ncbi:hypothetical protein F8388_011358 [Cannabis sativa]|uniref:PPIase cyclophilin-type domain-containing protein n=1 Tax=Cannabis sativa TaxID=3483 RepID=A0A7J6EVU2_CANSA|nr:hypothetical protein F8388_011358 [Cannabis sativa]
MPRRNNDPEATTTGSTFVLLCSALISCLLVYGVLSVVLRPSDLYTSSTLELAQGDGGNRDSRGENGECCKGVENLELWGAAVKWGSEFKFNTSDECCKACKAMCTGNDGPCLCDTWVFCGNQETCGSKFGECWLKKQKDTYAPDRQESDHTVSWTSGIIFGKGEGIIGMKTKYGTLHIKLFPDCAPHSVAYILELLKLRHCAGCEFYRAESRGESWDLEGNHIDKAPYGPPFALIQGTLEAVGTTFNKIPTEVCPTIKRGSVAWIGSGPEFFISLANHQEWRKAYTVFGSVLPEDMKIAEKIALLPTVPDVWKNINVSILEQPVPLSLQRFERSHGALGTSVKSD